MAARGREVADRGQPAASRSGDMSARGRGVASRSGEMAKMSETRPSEDKLGDSTLPPAGNRHPHLNQERLELLERHRKLREGLMQAVLDENPAEIESYVTRGASLLHHYYSKRSEARIVTGENTARGWSRYTSKGPLSGLVNPVDWATLERRPGPALQILELADGRTVFDRDEKQSYLEKVNLAQQTCYAVAQASFHGYVELLRGLLSRGAHVGQCNIHGDSALLLSVRAGREQIAFILLEHGAWQVEEQKRAVLQCARSFAMESVLKWGPASPGKAQPWDHLVQDFAEAQTCDERVLRLDTLLEASRSWVPQPVENHPNPAMHPWRGPSPNSLGGMSPSISRLGSPLFGRSKPSTAATPMMSTTAPSMASTMASAGELPAEYARAERLHELQDKVKLKIRERESKVQHREALVAERDKLHSISIAELGSEEGNLQALQGEIDGLDAELDVDSKNIKNLETSIYHLSAGRLEDGTEPSVPFSALALGWHAEQIACSADVKALDKVRREFQQSVKRSQSTVYRGLLREGALLNVKFDLGYGEHGNFLDWVVVKNYPGIALELMQLCREVGFVREFATEARAAFFWSVVQGYTAVLRELLSHGADVAQRHKIWSSGDSALDLAVFGSRTAELCVLLHHGAWKCETPERQTEILRWARSRPTVLQVFRNEGIVKDRPPTFAYQREALWNVQEVKPDVGISDTLADDAIRAR